MKASSENIKRALQQMQDAAADGIVKGYGFGLAIAFITTVFSLTKQLSDANRLPTAAELELKRVIAGASWTVTQSEIDPQKDGGDQDAATYRHLRNCFAHGNWSYDESTISAGSMIVELVDTNTSGVQRFAATIDLPELVDLTEKLLVATFDNL